MALTIDVPFTVAQDGPVSADSYKAFWATNPMPRALANYWKTHRRGGSHGARRRNPLEQIGYPKRKLKTVEFRGGKGRWQKIAEALRSKMKRAVNPYPTMAMVNPHRGHPFKVITLRPKHRPRGHNPVAASGPGGFAGFFKQLTTFKALSVGGTAVTAAVVDRQLVPRVMMMVPDGGFFDWFKKGLGYFITRLVFALVPAAAIYKWGSKTYGLAYGIGGAGSVAVSALEYGMNRGGVQTMGELAGTVTMLNGAPDGPLAEWLGGYEGDRKLSGYEGDRPTTALMLAPPPRPRLNDLAEGDVSFSEMEYAAG